MSLTTSEMTPADIRACTCNNDGNNGGMWGGDWLAYLLLFALIGGGGFGFGGFGGGGVLPWLLFGNGGFGGAGATNGYVLTSDFANIERKLDGINNGLCDGFYAQNTNMLNGFAGVQQTLCQGFSGINSSVANLGYQQAQYCCDIKGGIKDVAYGNERNSWNISKQISDCCCDLEKMNMQNRFDAQAYNCNTLQAIDASTDRILKYLQDEKTQALRDENFALRLSASQAKQNEYLIARLGDMCPEPAYIVQPPQQVTFPTNCCGQVQFANAGCGCGSY